MQNDYFASDRPRWKTAIVLGVLLLLSGLYAFQRYLDHRLELAQAEWESEIAQAQSMARAAQLRLASLTKSGSAQRDEQMARDLERMRADAYNSHARYQENLALQARAREQARQDKEREQQAAASSSRNQVAALQRALDIPIQRH